MQQRRVVVTGLGVVSPVGLDVPSAWRNVLEGRSGVSTVDRFNIHEFPVRIAGAVRDFDITRYVPEKQARKMDAFIHFGLAAADEAIRDSGLEVTENNAERIGVAVGSGIGGIGGIENTHSTLLERGPKRVSPFFVPACIINMVAGNISIRHGLRGPNFSVVSACATGSHNIGEAARMIAYGDADVMVAGGTEMATTPVSIAGFAASRALSTRNDEPERASRPWDRDRDGFVLSDGAGVVVLEDYEGARKRGARIYAELIGYGTSSDAYHMTAPQENGAGAARCMRNALHDAGLDPEEVDYINAHGTSTPAGDKAETLAMKAALGDHAYRVAISSTKSMTGHTLGAAGGIEAAFAILSIRDNAIPPTINLENPDPECDLDFVPNTARSMPVRVAMSNSFGFGGTNATLVFRRLDAG